MLLIFLLILRYVTTLFHICSGAVAAFYIYRIVLERNQQNGSNLETEPGN